MSSKPSIPQTGSPRSCAKDYTVGLTGQGSGVDPDLSLNLAYRCGGELNYNGYCSPEVDKLIDRQSIEPDLQKRKKLVWEIERKLAEDSARPIIFYDRRATCRLCQGVDDDGQQHLQRLANGRCLARQINVDTVGISNNGAPGPRFPKYSFHSICGILFGCAGLDQCAGKKRLRALSTRFIQRSESLNRPCSA